MAKAFIRKSHEKWDRSLFHPGNFDYPLFMLILLVSFFGIFIIYGATYLVPGLSRYAWKQLIWLCVSLPVFFLLCLFDYRRLRQAAWPFYIAAVLSLVLLPVLGHKVKGATSWYAIGSHRIQPSEFTKIAVVLCLAHYLTALEKPLKKIQDILIPGAIAGIPALLILKQPDFGTASLFFPILLIMLYMAGASKRLILLLILMVIWSFTLAYPFLKPYQKARITVFINPDYDQKWQGYNIKQAEISLGSGGITGKGWKQGTQTRLRFLPERHTDFIYSSLGEQFGLAGCSILLILYTLIIFRTITTAHFVRNKFGRNLVIGLLACFLLHIFLNVGMTLRLLPVTGLPLPLFSYGGSFLLTNFIIFGIIQSIGMRKLLY
jgi:rod shape determining protein RodA